VTSPYHRAAAVTDADAAATAAAVGAGGGGAGRVLVGAVRLSVDGMQLSLNDSLFTYTEDPVITDLQPTTSFVTCVHALHPDRWSAELLSFKGNS